VLNYLQTTSGWTGITVDIDGVTTYIISSQTTTWAKGIDEISGLSHLEGETVAILANGSVETQQRVISGSVTISNPATTIHVGLPIQADIETLDLELGQPTTQGKTKSVATVKSL
jgi:hypothetical protein